MKLTEDDLMTETEFASASRVKKEPHPLCVLLRRLRQASGVSLQRMEQLHGLKAVVLGAYERGDREPPIRKLDEALRLYGYQLAAIPIDADDPVQLSGDYVADLRRIADHLEQRDAMHKVS